jgi:Zn-dependent peptidase ImmA (M78 family)/transcriptional regulator with XRE-family HTH domain
MKNMELARRLKKAREAVCLTIGEAAAKIGFANYQALSNIEKGEREVKASELVALAKAYFCDLNRLLMAEPAEEPAVHFLWRKSPGPDKKVSVEADVKHRFEQYHLLEQLLGIVQEGNPRLISVSTEAIRANHQVDSLASKVSNMLDLGSRPALALQKVMEQTLKTKILYVQLSDFGSAASTVHPVFGAAVVVISDEAPWRINFTLAHELFHILTWDTFTASEIEQDEALFRDLEKKAERFASTLLLPEREVRQELNSRIADQKLSFSDIVDVAREFGVSTQSLLYRMANMHLIPWQVADEAKSNDELLALDRRMRRDVGFEAPESERFILLAAKCLRKGLLSRGKFAELMEIDRSDIDEYLEYRGLTEAEGVSFEIMAA